MVSAGEADIGIVPAFELLHQDLEVIPGLGIACRGAVRSILLVSKVEAAAIRTLAADSSSRTSVELARIVLARKYGARPVCTSHAPALETMLRTADAALLIGDPALRLDPAALPYHVYDLGLEWCELTGRPMVFAVWAGRKGILSPAITQAFHASYRYGRTQLNEIVRLESLARSFAPALVRRYLITHILHEIGEAEHEGMRLFLQYARERVAA